MTPRLMEPKEALPDSSLEVAAEWLARIQDPEASEADFSEWEKWLTADASHSAAYAAAEEVWALAARVDPPWPTQKELVQQALAEAGAFPKASKPRSLNASFGPFFAAAAAVAIAALGLWIASRERSIILETTTAEQRSLILPDGSRVTLSAETRLIVDARSERRSLKLERGEAYFEVARDPNRPFVVRVGNHEAIATGTAFDVSASADRMTVTVTDGVVQLQSVRGNSSGAGAAAAPLDNIQVRVGERVSADEIGTRHLARVVRPDEAIAWRDGRLEYLQETLQVVIQDVNRYTNRKIRIADASIGQLRFTGTVFVDQLDGWLDALQITFPIEVIDRGSHRLLQRSGQRTVEVHPQSPTVPAEVRGF